MRRQFTSYMIYAVLSGKAFETLTVVETQLPNMTKNEKEWIIQLELTGYITRKFNLIIKWSKRFFRKDALPHCIVISRIQYRTQSSALTFCQDLVEDKFQSSCEMALCISWCLYFCWRRCPSQVGRSAVSASKPGRRKMFEN